MHQFPPTIIVVHPKEKRSKCTVEPLRGTNGFTFCRFPHSPPVSLEGYVRLGIGGTALTQSDATSGLLVLDGTWRLTSSMERDFQDVPVRSLPPWETAYPRTSKLFDDPGEGLATIEAIFAAYSILGRDTEGLLDAYHWKAEFLARNAGRIADLSDE